MNLGSEHTVQRKNLIRVLGPIDVLTPQGPVSVGGHHARALLGALVLSAGRSTSVNRLREALWLNSPPPSADNSLQTYVWRLRKLLGDDAIIREDHSYRLDVGRDQIDALRFEDLLERASDIRDEPERCSAWCREALALWRGDAFGELGDQETFRLEAMRLDELRFTAMELDLEAQVRLGHHETVAAELECVVREHPYRERMWFLLIEALRRDGRRTDALRACRRFRHQLAELGLEPTSDLAEIEVEIAQSG